MNRGSGSIPIHHWVTFVLVSAIALYVVGIALMASVPPVSRDALIHHLAVPKLYLQHGGMVELPTIPFSYYPMNLDLLYLIPLMFGNDIIPKYIHMLFSLSTAGLIFHYLKLRLNVNYGLCGALLWLSTPIITRLSAEIYVDLGLAFFSFASLYQVIVWVQSGYRGRHLVYAGILCGMALGTKYNALLTLTVLSLMIPFVYSRLAPRPKSVPPCQTDGEKSAIGPKKFLSQRNLKISIHALLSVLCFIVITLVVFSPWMIRNTVLKRNPIYPMMSGIFNPEEHKENENWSQTSTIVQKTGTTLAMRRTVFNESLGYIALIPIRLFFEGEDDDPRRFDGKLNPFLLVFIIAGLFRNRSIDEKLNIERWVWSSFALLFLLFLIFTAPIRVRYLAPIIPACIILTVMGIHNLHGIVSELKHSPVKYYTSILLLSIMVTFALAYNTGYLIERFRKLEPIAYISGNVSREQYIEKRRPEYPLIQYVNAFLSHDDLVLGIFLGQRRYYFDRNVNFNEGILLNAVQRSDKPEQILEFLQHLGITHVMVRIDLFLKWLPNNLTDSEKGRLEDFWNSHTRKLKSVNGFGLYALQQ